MSATRRVCLFGTSANPPTGEGGHAGIVQHLADLTWKSVCSSTNSSGGDDEQEIVRSFDEVRVLPVYKHMFQEKRGNQASYEDRLAMCKLAFSHVPNVIVSDDERRCFEYVASKEKLTTPEGKQALRVGTADLLDMLLEQNKSESKSKSVEYTLALGDDTFMDLSEWKWRRSKDIIEILQGRIVIFRRLTKVDTSKTNNSSNEEEGPVDDKLKDRINLIADELKQTCPDLKHNLRIMDVELSPISSSLARECKDEEGLSSMLSDKVVNYIKDHKMYAFSKD